MKLHLPKGLRTALLACILAASPTYAETLTTEAISGLVFGTGSNTSVTSSDVTQTNTRITFNAFAGNTTSAQSWYLDLKFNAIANNGASYSGSHDESTAIGLSAYINNGNKTICIAEGGTAKSAAIPVVVGNTYRLAYDAVNHQVYLLDLTSSSSYRTSVVDTGISNLALSSETSWYWTNGNKNHATLIGGARIGADAASWTSLDFMQTIGYDPWLNQPMFGGPVYTYSTASGGFKNAAGEDANPDRGGKGGPLLVFDSVGVVSAKNTKNTSDYGGIKVTGHSAVSCDLSEWAGAIHVGTGSILNVSYGTSLKNTESNNTANVYVDGLLNFVGRGDTIDLNDGNTFQNWHIGENGLINLGSTVKNFRLKNNGGTFHLEIVVNTKDEEISGLSNRGTYGEVNVSRTILTMAEGGNVYSTASSDCIIFDQDGHILADATLSDGGTSVLVNYKKQGYATMELFTDSDVAWKNNGTETNTLFKDVNGVATSYRDGDSVTITGGTVTAQEDVSVAALSLNGGTLDLNAHVVNAHSLSIGGGATIKEGAGQLLVGSLQASGSTAALTIDGTLTFCSPLVIENQFTLDGGNLILQNSNGQPTVQGGKLIVEAGTVKLIGAANTFSGTGLLVSGGTLEINCGALSDQSCISVGSEVKVTGGTLRLTGHDMLAWSSAKSPNKIILGGESTDKVATLDFNDTDGSNPFTWCTSVDMGGNSVLTGTKIMPFGATVNVSGTNNKISAEELQAREVLNLTVEKDGELLVSSKIVDNRHGTNNIVKAGEGRVIFTNTTSTWTKDLTVTGGTVQLKDEAILGTGAISLAKDTTLEIAGTKTLGDATTGDHIGKSVVGEGKLSVLTGANLTVTGDVTLGATIENAGTFTLATGGSLSFTSKDVLTEKDIDYVDAQRPDSGNGYVDGSFLIVAGSAGASASGITSVTVGNQTFTSTATESGSFIASDGSNVKITGTDAQKDLFYIMYNETDSDNDNKKDCVVYQSGSRANSAANTATTGLVLDKAALETEPLTLVMKNNLNENATSGIIVLNDATIKFDGTNPDGTEIRLNKATILQKEVEGTDGSTRDFTPTLKLTGKGTYVMDNAMGLEAGATQVVNPTAGTDTTPSDPGWTGTVEVTNTKLGGNGDDWFSITELNHLASTGTVDGTTQQTSTIKISGLSGYAYDGADGTSPKVTADLVLVDIQSTDESTPDVAALTLTDGPETAGTLALNGKLSGTGSIVNNSKGNVSLGGDIKDWTGSYTASESTSLLTLADGAKLNASVNGGSMKLLGALTLGETMSLTGDLTGASTITLDGAALDATKTAITVGGEASGSGTLNFTTSSGNLDFLQDLPDGAEFKLLNAEGGIVGYDKATVNEKESFTQNAADGTEVRYYIAMNDTSVTLSKVTLGLTWHGDETNGWTSSTGFGANADAQLTKDSYVSFAGDGSSKVIVNSDQTVKGIAVDFTPGADRDAYTLSGKDVTTGTLSIAHGKLIVQNNLTVNELTSIHTGTSLTVEGEGGSLESEKMTNNGTLTIGSGSTVKVGSISGDGIVGGDGKLVVSGEISADIIAKNTGTIELEKLDKNVASKGVQGTLLVRESGTFTGNYNSATSIGTVRDGAVQELAADEKLTVVGTLGTVELTGLNSAYADSNKLDGIATTGASVKLNNKTTDDGKATTVTLGNASTMKDGVLDFIVSATEVNEKLKANDDKPTVTTGSSLSLKDVTLKVHEVENTGLDFNAGGKEKDILLFVLNDRDGCSVSNVTVDMSECTWMTKYFTNFRAVEGSVDIIADANTGYYVSHGGQTPNGTAGLALAGKAMFHLDPRSTAPNGELAQVLTMLDNHIATGNKDAMDKLGAALAGSSLSAVGLALADDVQRQLRSIRNRTTTMGVNECVVNEDMPYVNGWISGDGNYRQLSESGTDAGYQVSSWGGTVGVDVDVNPNLTLGVAVSALFGDYTGKAADTLTGDLDTQYVSLFARVSTGSWVNTFVGTLGRADVDLERTIPGVTGKTTYKTNGMMFGFLYEVARTFALNDEATTCVQPLFNMSFSHTTLDSATEGGTADTRLTTDSASLTQFSLGLGGRLQSVVGENEYNRASIFEARALLKLDFGDRYNKLNTALAVLPTATVTTRSNEKGVIGAELGATLTIPISQDAGSIFFDVNADFNADEVGVNGSVGYRVNF
ncbi:MAG: autotransporter domain-containing protein [Akkermansia sp.]|nr:autotransporter domain-containing protein [Akkermansia sp.]